MSETNTPKLLAEKIYALQDLDRFINRDDLESLLREALEDAYRDGLKDAPFITEAKAAAYEEGAKHQFAGDKEHYEARIKQAVDLAYEESAKVAEDCLHKETNWLWCDHGDNIVQAIRRLAEEQR